MSGARNSKVRIPVTEQVVRFFLCRKLRGARGHLYTIKASQICSELYHREDDVPQTCKVAVRRYLLSVLNDAIVHELSDKYRIVVQVDKARELLSCAEYEN